MGTDIELSDEQQVLLIQRLQRYCGEELDRQLGRFEAESLLDFIVREIGVVYYNQGLCDARAVLEQRVEELGEAIYQLEKPLPD